MRGVVILGTLVLSMVASFPAEAVRPNEPGGSFTDEDGSSHEGAIEAIAAAGITVGCNEGNYRYCPGGAVTRGQMAAFLDRALSLPPTTEDFFADDNSSAFHQSINNIAAAGISRGCSMIEFCPNRIMTRAEMAALLVRALSLRPSAADSFTDDNGHFLEADINALAAAGVTTGCAPGAYCPGGSVRRDEMATLLTRALPHLTAMPPPAPIRVPVVSITDGDTIRVVLNGVNEPLRFIGIDTPERGQRCFDEATEAMQGLVADRTVRIDVDISQRDRFDRLLRYVFLPGGVFVNAEMVRQGWAAANDFPPDSQFAGLFASLQAQAQSATRGIWGSNCTGTPPQPPPPGGQCDPSYPDVCIASPPPDLDCPDIPHRDFRVIGSDPHRFDGNDDGVGCET